MAGNILWNKPGIISPLCSGSPIIAKQTGGYIYASSGPDPSQWKIILQKTDVIGDTLPHWVYGNTSYEYCPYSLIQLADGDYIIAADQFFAPKTMSLLRTDSSGNIKWFKNYLNSKKVIVKDSSYNDEVVPLYLLCYYFCSYNRIIDLHIKKK